MSHTLITTIKMYYMFFTSCNLINNTLFQVPTYFLHNNVLLGICFRHRGLFGMYYIILGLTLIRWQAVNE